MERDMSGIETVAALRRHLPAFIVTAVLSGTGLFAWAHAHLGRAEAEASVQWGRVVGVYGNYVPDVLRDANLVERYFNDQAFEEGGFEDCRMLSTNVGLTVLEIVCEAESDEAALDITMRSVDFIMGKFNVPFGLAAEAAENQRDLLQDRLAIASQAVEELEETDPDDRELVLYRQALPEWRRLKNHARADILFFDLETAEMRRAELIEAPTVVDTSSRVTLVAGVSAVFGLLMGLFAALVFAAFDVLLRKRPASSGGAE